MIKVKVLILVLLPIMTVAFGANLINESFYEMDLRQALSQLSYDTGETIIADETVGGYITMDLKDMTLDKALDLVLLPGGFSWTKVNGIYFVSKAMPESDKFMYFATTVQYKTKNYNSSDLVSLLPSYMRKYVNVAQGDPYILTITAPKTISQNILSLLENLDKPKNGITLQVLVVEVDESLYKNWQISWGYDASQVGTMTSFSISDNWFSFNVLNPLGALSGDLNIDRTTEDMKALSESSIQVINGVQTKTFSKTTRVYQYVQDTTVNYKNIDIGVETDILPLIMGNKVILNISQLLFSAEESGTVIPSAVQQGIQTAISLEIGSRIAVASLSFKTLAQVEAKMPLLGDIPLVGKLFTETVYREVQKRVVLFVTAKAGGEL